MRKIKITVVTLFLLIGTINANQDPCGSHFQHGVYFSDLEVIETVNRRKLNVMEVMELLDKLPNVKTVLLHADPRRPFSIDTLAYPQYADRYALTQGEWLDLQAYCREKLKNPIATDQVVAHWRSIVAGNPPFGLRVRDK